jgi:hypothetical protein
MPQRNLAILQRKKIKDPMVDHGGGDGGGPLFSLLDIG